MTLCFITVVIVVIVVIFVLSIFLIFVIFLIFLPWRCLGACRLSPCSSTCSIVRQGVVEGIDIAINCSKKDRVLVAWRGLGR